MFKIGRTFMILFILLFVMGLIGWGVYLAVQRGFSGIADIPAGNNVFDENAYSGKGLGTGLIGGAGRNTSPDSFAPESAFADRGQNTFSIGRGLAGLPKDIVVIGMISLVVGGIDAFIRWVKRRSSRWINQERVCG